MITHRTTLGYFLTHPYEHCNPLGALYLPGQEPYLSSTPCVILYESGDLPSSPFEVKAFSKEWEKLRETLKAEGFITWYPLANVTDEWDFSDDKSEAGMIAVFNRSCHEGEMKGLKNFSRKSGKE